jgi:proline iminopeptidase
MATVITYDMRNRGRSERSKDVSIQQDVADLEAVRSHFKVDKFVPIGFSYLGLVVAMYAIDHPEHVSRIVQLGPVPPRSDAQYPKELANGTDDVAASEADVERWHEMRAQGMAEKSPREFCEAYTRSPGSCWSAIRQMHRGSHRIAISKTSGRPISTGPSTRAPSR